VIQFELIKSAQALQFEHESMIINMLRKTGKASFVTLEYLKKLPAGMCDGRSRFA